MELCDLTIHELKSLYTQRQVLPSEVLASVIARIKAVEGDYGAYLALDLEAAAEQAKAVDAKLKAGKTLAGLEGIPVAINDNLCQAGKETTAASRMLQGFIPPYTATAVRRLLDQGVLILGRTNMDEFAMGSSTENSVVKKTRNPWDPQRTPGGASGGSAVAVAAGEAMAALGSDAGGSIRQPAAFCGVTGLRPTYGLVSRHGLIAFSSSLDQIGLLAKDVEDCALLLDVIAGSDPRDSTSVPKAKEDYTLNLGPDLTGRRIGLPREYFDAGVAGVEEGVKQLVLEAVAQLQALGGQVVEVSLPHTEYALPAYYSIAAAEASSNLARYDGIRYGRAVPPGEDLSAFYTRTRTEGFGPEVKRQIMLGTYLLSAGNYEVYYKKAQQVRTQIIQDFREAFQQVDAIVTPATPTPAFKLGEKSGEPLLMYLSAVCSVPVDLAGLPAIAVPCGFTAGLPVGMQLIGPPFAEGTILNIAHQYQRVTAYHKARPGRIRKEGAGCGKVCAMNR